jgi:hypothetical protein
MIDELDARRDFAGPSFLFGFVSKRTQDGPEQQFQELAIDFVS